MKKPSAEKLAPTVFRLKWIKIKTNVSPQDISKPVECLALKGNKSYVEKLAPTVFRLKWIEIKTNVSPQGIWKPVECLALNGNKSNEGVAPTDPMDILFAKSKRGGRFYMVNLNEHSEVNFHLDSKFHSDTVHSYFLCLDFNTIDILKVSSKSKIFLS